MTKRKVRAVRSYEQSAEVKVRMSPEHKDHLLQIASELDVSVNRLLHLFVNDLIRAHEERLASHG